MTSRVATWAIGLAGLTVPSTAGARIPLAADAATGVPTIRAPGPGRLARWRRAGRVGVALSVGTPPGGSGPVVGRVRVGFPSSRVVATAVTTATRGCVGVGGATAVAPLGSAAGFRVLARR